MWPRGIRRWSTAAQLLGLWFRIPPVYGCLPLGSVVFCLRRAHHSSRGVLTRVVCPISVIANPRKEKTSDQSATGGENLIISLSV